MSLYCIAGLEYVEDIQRYRPGGFHPVEIGDILNDKYKILHKLGYGGFSTLWLARNLKENRNVAIKVQTADSTNTELEILTYLRARGAVHPNILALQESFEVKGPNGLHNCLVLDIVGPSISKFTYSRRMTLPWSTTCKASQQIASGLAYLHSFGICHGDLTDSNALFELNSAHLWTEAQIYQYLGVPKMEKLKPLRGSDLLKSGPREIVEATSYPDLDPNLLTGVVRIVDFGQSFFTKRPPSELLGTPASFLAPELLFDFPATEASDIWALGCLLFQLQTSQPLFPAFFGTLMEGTGLVVDTFGPFPQHWKTSYVPNVSRRAPTSVHDIFWFDGSFNPSRSLKLQLEKYCSQLPAEYLMDLHDLLKRMFVYEPGLRLSAGGVNDHQCFRNHNDM